MGKISLFENESASEDELEVKFNPEYAKSYNKLRQKELLKKLKDEDSDSDSEESDSSEDEEDIDPEFDKEFFKTLSSLKSKDPKIYDKETKFFSELKSDQGLEDSKSKKLKPLMIKDYERKIILEKGGKFEDDESEGETKVERPLSPSYVEEQKKIKAQISKVLNESDEENEDFGMIFKKRIKSKEEKDKEDEEYIQWLAGQKDDVEESTKKSLRPLKQFWDNPELPKNEKFLRDYVLNKGYIDTDIHEIPTYEEIVGDANLSEDEKELEKQAEFEQKYNFRFEEPDQEFIKRYPRTIENSVRRSDDSRKRKRNEAKERKLKEKADKMKELEILKEMKRKEIEDKINKLKEVTGNENLAFEENELESDFDPETHDKRMKEIFNEEYYQVDEGEEKPSCPDLEELKIEDWDNFDPKKEDEDDEDNYELHCEDENFNMDCDYDPNSKEKLQKELIENIKGKRKRRRRNKFMEMIKEEKPVFDPKDEKTYAQYIDEYYKMDCEDFIGDMPCRFKYVECEPNDFGLTIEEILLAKNKELNQWASLKKAVQIRPSHIDKKERRLYQMKAQNEALKRKIFTSLYGEPSDEENDQQEEIADSNNKDANGLCDTTKEKKKKKKKKKKSLSGANTEVSKIENKVAKINEPEVSNKTSKSSTNCTNMRNDHENPGNLVKTTETEKGKPVENLMQQSEDKPLKKGKNKILNISKSKNSKQAEQGISQKSKNIKKSNFKTKNQNNNSKISDERLKAYGLNPKKFYKKIQFANKQNKNCSENAKTNKNKRKNPFT